MPEQTRYQIGRALALGPLYRSFDLVWKDGTPTIENEDTALGPSTAERAVIARHLQSTLTGIKGRKIEGGSADRYVEVAPGTLEHFQLAAHQMPKPFGRLPI